MSGNLYESGDVLPTTLIDAVAAFRKDTVIQEILDNDVCNDLCIISEREWNSFISAVTQWDYDRYLKIV
jgi:glutamine synthetase